MLRRSASVLALCLALAAGAAEARGLTPADLVSLDRVSGAQPSPDGRRVAYDVRSTDLKADKGRHRLYVSALEPGAAPMAVAGGEGATSAAWAPDGRSLYLLKDGQVWRSCAEPGCAVPPVQVTHLPLDVGAFRLSPDGRRLVVSMAVFPDADDPAATRAKLDARAQPSAGTGRVYDRLFVRHWDTWADGTKNHLFSIALDASGVATGPAVPLTAGFDGDVPGKPFGDEEDFTFSPDGRTVYFSARLAGRSEPWSTNFDIYAAPADGSGHPRDLTADNKAWDSVGEVSPDGRTLAYRAMRRPGFEADRFGVVLMDLSSGARRELAAGWDRSAGPLRWSKDGRSLYTTADDGGYVRLFRIDPVNGAVTALTAGGHVSEVRPTSTGGLVLVQDSMTAPAQVLYKRADAAPGEAITRVDAERLAGVVPSTPEPFTFTGWNGDTVHGWLLKPSGYQSGRKYPVAFLIHGGPQGSWSDSWSYRWNPQVFTGHGYAVVMIDPHGSTGYGQAFTDAISDHWGDRPLEDLQKGWAAALGRAPWLDAGRACALGASYGGFMVNWIAGVWNGPWRCLVTHDGVFDDRMMGFSTEELWFSEWEHGGPGHTPWADPAAYERFNPANHVADWTKPQLIIHSEKDFRIPIEQGLGAFDALQRRGVDSRLLTFPDENHWVLKPANSLTWHAVVLDWLDQHTR
jgi:dipeptidyl aminopeptidase/acylaminoacyl peptidase